MCALMNWPKLLNPCVTEKLGLQEHDGTGLFEIFVLRVCSFVDRLF
jgi:hypothetical protein